MNHENDLFVKVVGNCLFGRGHYDLSKVNMIRLLSEANAQAVFPLVFVVVQEKIEIADKSSLAQSSEEVDVTVGLTADQYQRYSDLYLQMSVANYQNFSEHGELHELMTGAGIPYVVIKGIASAMYYPEPNLRSMGDVDFLVRQEDMEKAEAILKQNGFVKDHGEVDEGIHVAYNRPPISIWELHRNVNGVPGGEVGEKIQAEINRTIDTAVEVNIDGIVCRVPDKLHHGLIMLLHTASHLTSEGIGLRHLCDWVVFVSAMSDAEFREIFEKKLKSFGLWRFAQVLTLLGIRYIGAPKKVWALEAVESHKVDDATLEGLMNDILSGGNFGKKDANRYREIKYISDRSEGMVGRSGILRQGFKSMNDKVRRDYKTLGKHKALFPVGYLAEGGKYLALLLTGKRKSSGTKQMFNEAAERKRIYSALKLFE